jgi:hypothetical protein
MATRKRAAKKSTPNPRTTPLHQRLLVVVYAWVTSQAESFGQETEGPAVIQPSKLPPPRRRRSDDECAEDLYLRFLKTLAPDTPLTEIKFPKHRQLVRQKHVLAVWAWLQGAAGDDVEAYMKFAQSLPPGTVLGHL